RTNLFSGTPFQEFEVSLAAEMGPAGRNGLAFTRSGESSRTVLELGKTFTPLAVGGSGTVNAPLVFAGYGITAKNLKRGEQKFDYDEYAGIDAKGKVVIILRKEPQQKDKDSPFDVTRTTQHAYFN